MPFHRGVVPIRRTLKFLESGTIVFKDRVKVLTINYNEKTEVPVAKDVRFVNESIAFYLSIMITLNPPPLD